MKGLTTEVVVAWYNSNSLNIIEIISSCFFFITLRNFKAGEGKRDYRRATIALPGRYRGGGFKRGKCVFVTVVIEK